MSSSSDSEDDAQMLQFLEATDTTLLTNAMFQQTTPKESEDKPKSEDAKNTPKEDTSTADLIAKSQRYLTEEEESGGTDLKFPEAVQNHVYKKLQKIINENIEFCEMSTTDAAKSKKSAKSKVKLLAGLDAYVKPFEEFEYENKGPGKKPEIKRRKLETDVDISEEQRLKSVVQSAESILDGTEVALWAKKLERKDRVFHYKQGSTGMLHAKDEENEFTQLRRKNKWSEALIRQKKIKK